MGRRAEVKRRTRETEVAVTLELDGSGRYQVDTGIGFFDHMLSLVAKHGLLDLEVRARGDLEVTITIRWRTWASAWGRP